MHVVINPQECRNYTFYVSIELFIFDFAVISKS